MKKSRLRLSTDAPTVHQMSNRGRSAIRKIRGRRPRKCGAGRENSEQILIPISGARSNVDGSVTIFGDDVKREDLENGVAYDNRCHGTIGYSRRFFRQVYSDIDAIKCESISEVSS